MPIKETSAKPNQPLRVGESEKKILDSPALRLTDSPAHRFPGSPIPRLSDSKKRPHVHTFIHWTTLIMCLFALDLFTLERSDQLPFVPTVGLKIEVQ